MKHLSRRTPRVLDAPANHRRANAPQTFEVQVAHPSDGVMGPVELYRADNVVHAAEVALEAIWQREEYVDIYKRADLVLSVTRVSGDEPREG